MDLSRPEMAALIFGPGCLTISVPYAGPQLLLLGCGFVLCWPISAATFVFALSNTNALSVSLEYCEASGKVKLAGPLTSGSAGETLGASFSLSTRTGT